MPKLRTVHILKALTASVLIAIQAVSALAPSAQAAGLPTLGDGASSLTTGEERRLGDSIARELYRDPDYLDDPVLQEYVEGIWLHLQDAARKNGELSPELEERFAWTLLLGKDRQVNAFALPGGYMGVYLGLIGVVSSGDELASVIAHETSHITQRHIARMMAQQGKQTPLMLASMLLGALAATRSPDAAMAIMMGGPAAVMQNQLNFSRAMESEADRMGYSLMSPAGFAPQGFVSMFGKLQQASRLNDNGSWPYLRSHPLTTQRIADMDSRIPPGKRAADPVPTLEHVMMSARARVISNPGVEVRRQWARLPRSGSFSSLSQFEQVAQLYAATLSAMYLRDWPLAREMVQRLLAATAGNAPANIQARWLNAELEFKADNPQAALAALPLQSGNAPQAAPRVTATGNLAGPREAGPSLATIDVVEQFAPRRPQLLLKTEILLRLNQAGSMASPLQTWVTDHPRDGSAWQTLARVWRSQGQEMRALRAEAEAQVAHYDYAAAVDRFKAAQDLARKAGASADYFEASIIDTRLRAVEELLREQLRDKAVNK
ncbi:M48 family metalloprotease [Comamonas thiooxydans]|uniref:M48 family metalloprotease n=1 Tax=Comamonas thiooxydans TaxID=363952 RepID=A0AA42PXG9_9BURK|nr:M48 family metalloprotease [Comamonas thiooxydans]MDH1332814.1 M48 family metalloprotease [Comamonas thiooxydans]MDH1739826.1 M48 family metalloprotease [Comamonas thiooxydans]MDH1785241.1 M48 family metalloprotease [Comamonas thiooxydans]